MTMDDSQKHTIKVNLFNCCGTDPEGGGGCIYELARKTFVPQGTNYCLTFKNVVVHAPTPVTSPSSQYPLATPPVRGRFRSHGIAETHVIGNEQIKTAVYVKWAFDKKRIHRLHHEATVYEHKLGTIQGKVVPRFYGYFVDDTKDPTVACSIFEALEFRPYHSIGEWNSILRSGLLDIHNLGVQHNDLLYKTPQGSYITKPEHVMPTRYGPYLLDFTSASMFMCLCEEKFMDNLEKHGKASEVSLCPEIEAVEVALQDNAVAFVSAYGPDPFTHTQRVPVPPTNSLK